MLANVVHEGLGHGAVALMTGAQSGVLTTVSARQGAARYSHSYPDEAEYNLGTRFPNAPLSD